MNDKQPRARGGRFARLPGGGGRDASQRRTADLTTEELLVAEVDRVGRELARLGALKRRTAEQERQMGSLSRTHERLMYRLAQVRGQTRGHARVDDMDAAAAHHPGEDHLTYTLVPRGDVDPADMFGVVTIEDCPGCERIEGAPPTLETPALAEDALP